MLILCVVQRLCEELEYSELLDRVVEINDPFDRMVVFYRRFLVNLLVVIINIKVSSVLPRLLFVGTKLFTSQY